MVIVKIGGGLGNQLFQYAFGRSLAAFNNTELLIDTGDYKATVGDPKLGIRLFGLDNFKISARRASLNELKKFNFFIHNKLFRKFLRFYSLPNTYYKRSYLLEPEKQHFCFDSRVFKRPNGGDVYCDGYFQSEKYFSSIESLIREELSFKDEPDEFNARIIKEMANCNSVALHIRHGDNALAAKNHGVLPLSYYEAAVNKLSSLEKELVFYVFSDDPEWAKENLRLNFPMVFISHNGDSKNHEDLRLMTNCRHHIVGNSTFSWWGAWLGKKSGQKVFAPRYYHVGVDVSQKDFYPLDWVTL